VRLTLDNDALAAKVQRLEAEISYLRRQQPPPLTDKVAAEIADLAIAIRAVASYLPTMKMFQGLTGIHPPLSAKAPDAAPAPANRVTLATINERTLVSAIPPAFPVEAVNPAVNPAINAYGPFPSYYDVSRKMADQALEDAHAARAEKNAALSPPRRGKAKSASDE
jgi:hypothetical protein